MPKKNNVAGLLEILKLGVALDDIYLEPQALKDYEQKATIDLDPADKNGAK